MSSYFKKSKLFCSRRFQNPSMCSKNGLKHTKKKKYNNIYKSLCKYYIHLRESDKNNLQKSSKLPVYPSSNRQ